LVVNINKLFYATKYKLEIRSLERSICPIATLYSLAAAFQRLTLLWAYSYHSARESVKPAYK